MDGSMEAFDQIRQCLALSPCDSPISTSRPLKSFLFISIDLEYDCKRVTQLGVSIFDPRTLAELEHPVSNEYPISSTLYSTRTSKYRERRRKPSHFGEKRLLTSKTLEPILKEILTPRNAHGHPRDVILVGHNIACDLGVIERCCGLKICRDIASFKAVLDTVVISRSLLESKDSLSLKRLMLALNLDYIGLHNAAHDSRYTLRALLMMFCMTARQRGHNEEQPRLALIEKIAWYHQPRKKITWCHESPRIKLGGNPDVLDRDFDTDDMSESGMLNLLSQDEVELYSAS